MRFPTVAVPPVLFITDGVMDCAEALKDANVAMTKSKCLKDIAGISNVLVYEYNLKTLCDDLLRRMTPRDDNLRLMTNKFDDLL